MNKLKHMRSSKFFKKLAQGIVAGSILLMAVVFGLYFLQFHGPPSTSKADWGTFGDFVGGTLNAILGLANLGITAIIAFLVHKLSEEAKDSDLEKQKQIILIEFKYAAIKEFYSMLVRINETVSITDDAKKSKALEMIHSEYVMFKGTNKPLWNGLEKVCIDCGFDAAYSSLLKEIDGFHADQTIDQKIEDIIVKAGTITDYLRADIIPKFQGNGADMSN